MEREVTDSEGITWTCIQALSGISDDAAQVKGEDAYWVVCTPSGGAASVRLMVYSTAIQTNSCLQTSD
ncbi:hypothetical protein HJG54_31720 [Leptolyngbya sp. NK1-12]|uniref:Uncharacterized protein n=1 Tax=Leptolyngbya sp. NK1-12 TaxID=2547451 RepID=A0AA97AK65_9CYAN|nr:hypothetical protein [Leptolyngbya sp. NK1-12]WNZ27449.1 hypothetical protein HJG54_31720 [Leptolyngbya sp. NK1-12]